MMMNLKNFQQKLTMKDWSVSKMGLTKQTLIGMGYTTLDEIKPKLPKNRTIGTFMTINPINFKKMACRETWGRELEELSEDEVKVAMKENKACFACGKATDGSHALCLACYKGNI